MYKYRSPLEKQILQEQLSEYETQYTLTSEERQRLRHWVLSGNDVTSNPWHYEYDDGWEMDFIYALRMDEQIYETIKRMAEES